MKLHINTNEMATVKLTKKGKDILNAYYKENGYRTFATDTFTRELWEIMHIFGTYMCVGCEIPFENNSIEL